MNFRTVTVVVPDHVSPDIINRAIAQAVNGTPSYSGGGSIYVHPRCYNFMYNSSPRPKDQIPQPSTFAAKFNSRCAHCGSTIVAGTLAIATDDIRK